MIPFTLSTQKFGLPEGWHEVSFKQWMKLKSCNQDDICELLEALTGIDKETWWNTKEVDVVYKLIPLLSWIGEATDQNYFHNQPVPKSVKIGGVQYAIPEDIRLDVLGKRITFEDTMRKYMNGTEIKIEFSPIAIAIYLCPDKPFSDVKAMEFAAKCEELPITEVVPLANFFFRKFLTFYNTNMNNSLGKQRRNKSWHALMN